MKIDKQQLIEIIDQGRELLKDIQNDHSRDELIKYIESAQGLVKNVITENKDQGKDLVLNITKNHTQAEVMFQEGENLVKGLKVRSFGSHCS